MEAELWRKGWSLSLSGVLISVTCVRAGAALWTRDRDFWRVKEALPRLELYEVS